MSQQSCGLTVALALLHAAQPADAEAWGADPAMERARAFALVLHTDVLDAYYGDRKRWASAREPMLAMGRVALP